MRFTVSSTLLAGVGALFLTAVCITQVPAAGGGANAQQPINGTAGPRRTTPLIIPDNPAETADRSAAAATPVMGSTLVVKYAVVNANGTLDRGKGIKSVTHLGAGTYEILFNKTDIRSCAWTATIGNPAAGTPYSGAIQTALRGETTNGLFVTTVDLNGAL